VLFRSPSVGESVWASVGASVGESVWASVWPSVGESVGASVWAYVGSLFLGVTNWLYAPPSGGYPYQPAVDLWKQGLVPSFDGKVWRLHGGPQGKVLAEREAKRMVSEALR